MSALYFVNGPQAGHRQELTSELIIGRGSTCAIFLDDSKVSRQHARIFLNQDQVWVTDLASRNGTLVNGEKIVGDTLLLQGDRLQIGDASFVFDPALRATLFDGQVQAGGEWIARGVEGNEPTSTECGSLFRLSTALLTATSEGMVLRHGVDEWAMAMHADVAAALLGGPEGLTLVACVGAETVELPRELVNAAFERKEVSLWRGMLVAPLVAAGGLPFGVLMASRPESFSQQQLPLAAIFSRVIAEAYVAVRAWRPRIVEEFEWVGHSRSFRRSVDEARHAAAVDGAVFIAGEPGTGRTSIARFIHSRSSRALGPFFAVNCSRPPAELESELFGHTGRSGMIPTASALLRADGGTLLLQNVDWLPKNMALKLGRLLVRKMAPARQGGDEKIDIRIMAIAATPIDEWARNGEVGQELVDAVRGTEVHVPSLRERKSDVPLLFETLIRKLLRDSKKMLPTLSPDARRLMTEYSWPGNIEELKLVSKRLGFLYAGTEISSLQLPPEIQAGAATVQSLSLSDRVGKLERDAIAEALREARGKKIKAAAMLGISRPTLDKKIEEFQITFEKRQG